MTIPNLQVNAHPDTTAQTNQTRSFDTGGDPFAEGPNPFVAAPAPASVSPTGLPVGAVPPQANPVTPQSPQVGAVPPTNTPEPSAHPLDKHVPKADNEGIENKDKSAELKPTASVFDTTLERYEQALQNQDFVGEVSAEVMTAIAQGDATQFATVINNAVRKAAAASSFMSAAVSKNGIQEGISGFTNDNLPSLLENHSFNQTWQSTPDDVLKHPSVEPLARQQMETFRAQFPEASSQEITEKTKEYFKDFAKALIQSDENQQQPDGQQPTPSKMAQLFNR